MGLVGGMNIIQNIMLRTYRRGKGPLTDRKFPRDLSQKIVDDLEVVTPDIGRTLSAVFPAATCRRCLSAVRLRRTRRFL